jgi:ATP-dependent exoDNAse (exonuclease V) beta subunit
MNKEFSRLIPASAGSGKTYTLTKLLQHGILGAPWDANDQSAKAALPKPLRPEAVVAVTFTEAAAQELRQRVRGALMRPETADKVPRLDEAYISTIHAFGLRLLKESAFDRGEVLSPRLLTEDEQAQLLRQALGKTQNLQSITRDLKRFGYSYNGGTGETAEDAFRSRVMKVVELLSAMPEAKDLHRLRAQARDYVAQVYGNTISESNAGLAMRLQQKAATLLTAFPQSLEDLYPSNKSATAAFRANFDDLKSAAERPELLESDWGLWKRLESLRTSNTKYLTPEGYDDLAQRVTAFVEDVFPRHPGPLADAQDHIDTLLLGADEVLSAYREFKDEAGLFDYADMVGQAVKALQQPELRERLAAGMDCVVIDEFQDTNPLQFALMWSLMQADLPAVMVGDIKQSIMGFQGADSRLFKALVDSHREIADPLASNWRSQPRLMNFINAVSGCLFDDYTPLTPQAKDVELDPLHVLVMPDEKGTKKHPWRAAQIAGALKAKLDDPAARVRDRHTDQFRRLRGSDCAVLCPTHTMLATYAEALRSQGLSVRLKSDGWLESYEVQIALEALALLHDPQSRHARLYLCVSSVGEHSLQDAVLTLLNKQELTNPRIEALVELADQASSRTVDELIPMALEQMGLYDHVVNWPDSRQARANLLRLEGLARDFVDAQPESRMAAGIYGTGLPQFLCWVRQRAENDNDMPAASNLDEDAVELVTWHASKGREWPIVAVCGWVQKVEPRLPDLRLHYDSFDDLDRILYSAGIAWSPDMDCKAARDRISASLEGEHRSQILREIYVALTRPREQLLLEWPLDAVDPDKPTRAGVLQKRINMQLEENEIVLGSGERFQAVVQYASAKDEFQISEGGVLVLPRFGRRAMDDALPVPDFSPDSRSPSQHEEAVPMAAVAFETVAYAPPLNLPEHPDAAAVGTFVHRVFELGCVDERTRPHLLAEAQKLWPQDGGDVLHALATQVDAFYACLSSKLGFTEFTSEVPVFGLDDKGTVVNGIIDMLAESGQDKLVIDHKTDRGVDGARLLERHLPQMLDYQLLLGEVGLAVNAVRSGQLICLRK